MVTKDYYRIMGLTPNASEEEIKRAYRKLAMEYHPDRNRDHPKNVEKLKEINEAYHVLGNSERKTAYDTMTQPRIRNHPFAKNDFIFTDLEALFRAFSARNLEDRGSACCMKTGFGKGRCRGWRRSRVK